MVVADVVVVSVGVPVGVTDGNGSPTPTRYRRNSNLSSLWGTTSTVTGDEAKKKCHMLGVHKSRNKKKIGCGVVTIHKIGGTSPYR